MQGKYEKQVHSRKSKHKARQKSNRKASRKKPFARVWLWVLEGIGMLILIGLLMLYRDSARLVSLILNAQPVGRLTADMSGLVRLEGPAEGEDRYTDEGKLRTRYSLLQKVPFSWKCSKGACQYKLDDDDTPEVWGSLKVGGVNVKADRYQFYSDWLPLDFETVEPDDVNKIFEGGSTRPLLEEKRKAIAYGYYAVKSGDLVTVIGHANAGRLEPFQLPGENSEQRVLLIGSSVERMVSTERKAQFGYLIAAAIVTIMLLPMLIGWIRRMLQRMK